jgi:hypothetical protein
MFWRFHVFLRGCRLTCARHQVAPLLLDPGDIFFQLRNLVIRFHAPMENEEGGRGKAFTIKFSSGAGCIDIKSRIAVMPAPSAATVGSAQKRLPTWTPHCLPQQAHVA